MLSELDSLKTAALASLEAAQDESALEAVRVNFLGKKGSVTALSQGMKDVPVEQKKEGIYLRADKNVPYGVVTATMAAIHRAGFEKIGMITVPAEKDK